MSEQSPGRYSRSVNGLVASMVVIVLIVVAYVALRSLVTKDPDIKPQRVDYLSTVADLQRNGFDPIYPAALPASWKATNVDYTPGAEPEWGVSMLTGQGHYVGVQESGEQVSSMLSTYVNGDAETGTDYDSPSGLATHWVGWTGSDGDHAYSAKVGKDNVIVFGSAPVADLQYVVRTLTVAKLPSASVTQTPTPGATETF